MPATPSLLVLDLDGTVLDRTGRLADRDVDAARALRDEGVAITVNTGRLFTGTRWVAERLGVTGSVGVMNGSELVDVASARATRGAYLSAPQLASARRILGAASVSTFLFASRRIHYAARDSRYAPYLGIWTEDLAAHPDVFALPDWERADDVVAVCAVGSHDAIRDAEGALGETQPDLGTWSFPTRSGDTFLKVRRAGVDKGTALRELAAERGLGPDACVAVGDWINDLPMLEQAGRSFAMAHATEEVRAAADEVLEATDAGAVAEVAARVWGIRAGTGRGRVVRADSPGTALGTSGGSPTPEGPGWRR